MKGIIIYFVLYPKNYKNASRHSDGKSSDIDDCVNGVTPDATQRGDKIVSKHGLALG
jgi:hypothetical protein